MWTVWVIPCSGYFLGDKIFVDGMICGKKILVRVRSKPHPSCTRRAMASSFEVKAVVRGYHQYKAVWDAQVGYNAVLSSSLSNHSILFRNVLSILAPLFAVV